MRFRDRTEAGQRLAQELKNYSGRKDVIVLALPRGGVPVGFEVAQTLKVPLEVFVVRKLGVPGFEEMAMGAIASGGLRVLNQDVIATLGRGASQAIDEVTARETQELEARDKKYRGDRPFPDLRGRKVILVDDGLATGATMRVAARAARLHSPNELIIAVPVAAESSCRELQGEADRLVCAFTSRDFVAVGQYYEDFSQTSDEEVRALLEQATRTRVD